MQIVPGSLVTLLTDDEVINLRVVNVRERCHSIASDDIPANAAVLGVELADNTPQAPQNCACRGSCYCKPTAPLAGNEP